MCSHMIACIVIPGFELRAALRERPRLAARAGRARARAGGRGAARAGDGGGGGRGRAAGDAPGEALATVPRRSQLVDQDPAAAEEAWEQIVRRLEDAGFAVETAALGCVYFETRGVERLYGGLEPALKRALDGGRPGVGRARRRGEAPVRGAGGGERRASRARCWSSPTSTREFLAPLPLTLLPLEARRREELRELGITKARRACRAAGWRRGRTSGAGRPARLEPGERADRAGASAAGSLPRSCWRRSSSRRRSGTS